MWQGSLKFKNVGEEENKKARLPRRVRFSRYGQHLTGTGGKVPTRNSDCATYPRQLVQMIDVFEI